MRGEHIPRFTIRFVTQGPSPRARGAHPGAHRRLAHDGTIPACAGSTSESLGSEDRVRDHPRVRGEHLLPVLGEAAEGGPSPRARGAPRRETAGVAGVGTIPACAGSTSRVWTTTAASWDHPRMRGEHCTSRSAGSMMPGPSPHARGALHEVQPQLAHRGTIPACAGSTRGRRATPRASWDHPRMRGEHPRVRGRGGPRWGPSPHARGAPAQPSQQRAPLGTIPACAGSTWGSRRSARCCRDHPRMRGEHAAPNVAFLEDLGPSPHARGAQAWTWPTTATSGTIPACAGSTRRGRCRTPRPRDHPRMRGEHTTPTPPPAPDPGPSPHARGAQCVLAVAFAGAGTIPACAGSTGSPGFMFSGVWDHPRMRGEHYTQALAAADRQGPSPHARGAPFRPGSRGCAPGTIPACAGSTVHDLRTYQRQAANFPTSRNSDISPKNPKITQLPIRS